MEIMKPSVSIIIPCMNEEKHLAYLLEDLKAQSLQPFEIIVSDADSTDDSREIAKKYGAKIVSGGIPSVGRNRGAAVSTGELLVFFDADVRLKDTVFLEKMISLFEDKNYECATSMRLPHFEGLKVNWLRRKLIFVGYRVANQILLHWSKGTNPRAVGDSIIIKRNVFFKSSGFNENTYWGEDSELAENLLKKGHPFGCLEMKIHCSARKILKHGLLKSVRNVIILDRQRLKLGSITKDDFRRITKLHDYFEK